MKTNKDKKQNFAGIVYLSTSNMPSKFDSIILLKIGVMVGQKTILNYAIKGKLILTEVMGGKKIMTYIFEITL